jgi:hypothetical protein
LSASVTFALLLDCLLLQVKWGEEHTDIWAIDFLTTLNLLGQHWSPHLKGMAPGMVLALGTRSETASGRIKILA